MEVSEPTDREAVLALTLSRVSEQKDGLMKQRCEEEGHSWDNCCSVFLSVYQQCKWCGSKRP